MSIFRSEEMSLCQLFIQPEAIYATVGELGEIGIAQFKDLNPDVNSYQRKYTAEVRRIDDMERRLDVIQRELIRDELIVEGNEEGIRYPSSREFIDLEAYIEKNETEIKELSQNFSQLLENQRGFVEYKCVLERAELFFSEETPKFYSDDDTEENHQLHFVAGVIDLERFHSFERMLWRVSHGNVFMKQASIDEPFKDPKNEKDIFKMVFIAFFQGDQLKSKMKKICDGYRATIFPCPNDAEERADVRQGLQVRLADMATVINQTNDHRRRVLANAAKSFTEWSVKLKKLKAIYHTMNLFNMDVSQKCLIGECWVPARDIQAIQTVLHDGSKASESTVPAFINVIGTNETPPTFFRTNKFTQGFQNLIESYGVSSYREVNPAFYTVITFPFLFAVMFGDLGHGFIMFLIAGWMLLNESKLGKIKDEIFQLFYGGRYIILLMGIFSMYTGFIYNDLFSKSFNLFGTSWRINYNISTVMENEKLQLNPSTDDLMDGRTYPMGMDPIWALADNKILFLNSFKMKLSIIFGVVHMILGVCVSVINYNHFRRRISILLEFLPQIIFLVLLFGYLVFMMFWKWVRFDPKSEQPYSPGCAPSVLVYFINMMLFGDNKPLPGCDEYMYSGQYLVQLVCVLVGVLCIPWMLIGKPIYISCTRKSHPQAVAEFNHEAGTSEKRQEVPAENDHENEPMSEIWTHQAIHTIEYILGTVSHTASYLRLWALSLAHAQLSEVLWNNVMPLGFMKVPYVAPVLLYTAFYLWSSLTFGILIIIEGMSAFLHTLRLHWVEFMSKFYDGTGEKFQPFCFKAILNGED